MDFTAEAEDEFIRYSVSHKLNIPLVNTSNKDCRDSTQTKTPTSPFHISEYLRFTNEGHNEMVFLVDINTNYPYSTKKTIKFLRGNAMI